MIVDSVQAWSGKKAQLSWWLLWAIIAASYMTESAKLLAKIQFTQGKEAFRKLLRQ